MPGTTHWNQPGFHAYFANSASGPGVLGEMAAALPSGQTEGLSGLPPGRVYLGEAHSSIDKAVLTVGLGLNGIRRVETDDQFGMRVESLRRAIEEDLSEGARPVAVVATVGTTSAVSVDPVAAVAEVCEEFGIWLHVDAAYAGPIAICPEFRPFFEGWELADSIVVNPHKWLFTPMDCSILFARRPAAIRAAFSLTPSYLETAEMGQATNLMDYGVSLGRRMRSLKLWFVMRYFGRSGIQARLREHVRLARWFARQVEASSGWETVGPTHFATCVFRCAPEELGTQEADELNHRILERVNATGEAFMSHTVQSGHVWLRMSVGHLRTDEAQVRRVWELVTEAAARG